MQFWWGKRCNVCQRQKVLLTCWQLYIQNTPRKRFTMWCRQSPKTRILGNHSTPSRPISLFDTFIAIYGLVSNKGFWISSAIYKYNYNRLKGSKDGNLDNVLGILESILSLWDKNSFQPFFLTIFWPERCQKTCKSKNLLEPGVAGLPSFSSRAFTALLPLA